MKTMDRPYPILNVKLTSYQQDT